MSASDEARDPRPRTSLQRSVELPRARGHGQVAYRRRRVHHRQRRLDQEPRRLPRSDGAPARPQRAVPVEHAAQAGNARALSRPDIAILHTRFWIKGEVMHDALSQESRESVGTRVVRKNGGAGGSSRRRTPMSAQGGGIRALKQDNRSSVGLGRRDAVQMQRACGADRPAGRRGGADHALGLRAGRRHRMAHATAGRISWCCSPTRS